MTTRHIRALDGLRGLAILLVIPHNSEELFHAATGVVRLGAIIASAGWIGVQLFFVLSGFLITRNLLDSQGATHYFRVFFARRILRIFPLYYGTLLVALVIVPLITAPPRGPVFQHGQIWLWTFLLNWAHPLGASTNGLPHFWSLAVEEQFYLVWPLIVWHATPRSLLKVCGAIVVMAVIARTLLHFYGGSSEMIYEFTVCRMDALAIGAAAAALLRYPPGAAWLERQQPRLLPIAAVLTIIGAASTKAYTSDNLTTQIIGQTLLAIIFVLVLLACLTDEGRYNRWLRRVCDTAALRSVGRYSYGMYVLHFPIFLWLQHYSATFNQVCGRWAPLAFVGTMIVLAYIAGFISYHAFEKHFLRLKRWFVPQYSAVGRPALAGSA
ncbi:MAG TPA: acyltransferase [Gemmatimonadaceae bacterium]|nr:acyltransferase [Gemmatimonadaceae bacterium]